VQTRGRWPSNRPKVRVVRRHRREGAGKRNRSSAQTDGDRQCVGRVPVEIVLCPVGVVNAPSVVAGGTFSDGPSLASAHPSIRRVDTVTLGVVKARWILSALELSRRVLRRRVRDRLGIDLEKVPGSRREEVEAMLEEAVEDVRGRGISTYES
jgi:hypothetical protein